MGRHAREGAREADAPAGRADRAQRAGARRPGDPRHRPADLADEKATDSARIGELPFLRRGVHADERAQLSGRRPDAELHAISAGGRVRARVAVERAVHDRDVEDRAVPRARQHRGAEDVGALAAHGRPARPPRARGGHPGRRAQRRAGLRRDGGRRARAASGRARGVVYGRHGDGQADHGARGPEEILDGAGRQVARADLRRRRFRPRARRVALHDLLDQRRALHRGLADLRAAHDLRQVRRGVRAAREQPDRRRSGRREHAGGLDDHARALGKSDGLCPARRRGGRAARGRRPGQAGESPRASRERQFRAAERVRRRRQPDADRAGRDLRAGRVPDSVRRRGRRAASCQRHGLRSRVVPVDARRRPRAPARAASRRAWCSSTARTCAICASRSAA